MKHPPFVLNAQSRCIVQNTIERVAEHYKWYLHTVAIRTNHMHIIVSALETPERVLTTFKSWTTRRLRDAGCIGPNCKPWVRHGSTHYLWKMEQVTAACRYVAEGQGFDLPGA
jgi:REP element-mobilizing transposase RayT